MSREEKHEVLMKEKQKEHLINNLLLVALLFLLVYILFVTGIIKFTSKSSDTHSTSSEVVEESSNEEEKEKLKTNDNHVTALYKSVDLGRSYLALRHYYFYSYDSVYAKYMDTDFIKEMAMSKLTLQDDTTTIDSNILEDGFKNIVGNNAVYKNRSFQTLCANVRYNATTANYEITKNTTCDTSNPDSYEYFDKITSAYKYSDRIEIFSRVGYAEEEKQLVSDGVYESTGNLIVKKDMDDSQVIGTFTESLDQIKKSIDYSKLAKYKYTFRLENMKYYFYSVERVDKEDK